MSELNKRTDQEYRRKDEVRYWVAMATHEGSTSLDSIRRKTKAGVLNELERLGCTWHPTLASYYNAETRISFLPPNFMKLLYRDPFDLVFKSSSEELESLESTFAIPGPCHY